MLTLVEKRSFFSIKHLLVFLLCISVCRFAEFTTSLSSPIIIQWNNLNQGKGLSGSGRRQKLIIYGTTSSEYHLRKIDELPDAYSLQNSCTVIPSSNSTPIYAFHQYEFNAKYSFIYLYGKTVIQEGILYQSSHQIGAIERAFQILAKRQNNEDSNPQSIFFQHKDVLYELQSSYYSKQPKCYFLSHLTSSMICQQGCSVKTIKDIVSSNALPIKSVHQIYRKNFESVYVPLPSQNSKDQIWLPEIKIKQQGLQDISAKKLMIQANSTQVEVYITQKTVKSFSVRVIITNLKEDFILTHLQIHSDNQVQTKKIVLAPKNYEQFLMSVSQAKSVKVIVYNDLKEGVVLTPQIKLLQQTKESKQQSNQETILQQVQANATVGIIVGIVAGVSGLIFISCFSACIYRYLRNRIKQGDKNQQETHTKDSGLNYVTTNKSSKKQENDQNIPDYSMHKQIQQIQDSGRDINPEENEPQYGSHCPQAKSSHEYSIDQRIQEVSMKSKQSVGKTRPNTLQTLDDYLPPETLESLRQKR